MTNKFIAISGTAYTLQTRIPKSNSNPHTVLHTDAGRNLALLTVLTPAESIALKTEHGYQKSGRVLLAEGGEGRIRLARDLGTQQFLIVKKIRDAKRDNELVIQHQLPNHPNLLKISEGVIAPSKHDRAKLYLFMDIANYGEAQTICRKFAQKARVNPEGLPDMKKVVVWDMLQGLKALHDAGLAHQDIKLKNFLLFKDGVGKWIDFGYTERFQPGEKTDHFKGSYHYLSPELQTLKEQYHELFGKRTPVDPYKNDIYALGRSIYELDNGHYADYAPDAFWLHPPAEADTLTALSYFLMKRNPDERMSLEAALAAPCFQGCDFENARKNLDTYLKSNIR